MTRREFLAHHRLVKRSGDWLSRKGYSSIVASNPAAFVAVDFPPGVWPEGSCAMRCWYCYGCTGKQACSGPRACQWHRFDLYRADPAGYAREVVRVVRAFNERWGTAIGSKRAPMRMFGVGDLQDLRMFAPFAAELDRLEFCFFGFTRYLGADRRLIYSVDWSTDPSDVELARGLGYRIAWVREGEGPVPAWAWVSFPLHRLVDKLVVAPRDCPKLRHRVSNCYACGRCWRS